jgi:biopolymer transport protein ExbD
MSDLFGMVRVGGLLTITGLSGLVLQLVAVFLAFHRRRALARRPESRASLLPVLLSAVALLALLLVCYLMVEGRWARVIEAVQGADPASRQELLESPSQRLSSLQVFALGAVFLMLQALLGAVAWGLTLANRSSAATPDPRRLRAAPAVGVALVSVLLTVVPFGAGVVIFARRWNEIFGNLTGADPVRRCELLLAGVPEPRAALSTAALASAVGLALCCVLIAVFALRRRARAPSNAVVAVAVIGCAAASVGLWHISRRYSLDGAPPTSGPVKRYLEARKLPFDWIDRVRKDPDLLADIRANVQITDDLVPARSTSTVRCREAFSVTVTRRAILVEGEPVASVKRGAVDPSVKRDGASGYLIEPLHEELDKYAIRLKKIEKMTGGKMRFRGELRLVADHRTPYRLVSEVLYSAAQAEFGSYQIVLLAAKHKLGSGFSCITVDAPGQEEAKVSGETLLNLTVAVSYTGFIVAGAGELMVGPDGKLPTIRCSRALVDRRCPARWGDKAGAWTDGYDYNALTSLAARLKKRYPKERRVIVAADRLVPLQVVVRTLDALRGGASDLFDRAILSAGVE